MKYFLISIFFFILIPSISAYSQDSDNTYGSNEKAGQYLQVNGIKLYYENYGEGYPLLLIHGNSSSIKDMAAQIEYFSQSYNVIIADNRGHGKSGLGNQPLTYEKINSDLIALLDHLKIKKTNIIGWSDGAVVGLHIASKYPTRVNKLVSFAANLFAGEPAIYPWLDRALRHNGATIQDGLKKNPNDTELQHQKQIYDLMMNMTPITPIMLQQITAPTLVMAGDSDAITNHHTVDIFEHIPNAHLAIMPGQTHFMPMINPEVFNNITAAFLITPYKRPTTMEDLKIYFGFE